MRRSQLLRFAIALAAEILCVAALNLFDDWTLEEMPVKFVAAAMLGGIAFLFAVKEFPALTSRRAQVADFLGGGYWFALGRIATRAGRRFVAVPVGRQNSAGRF